MPSRSAKAKLSADEAMHLGYHVTLVKDATAAFSPEGMRAAEVNAPMFAHAILTTQELLARLPGASHTAV